VPGDRTRHPGDRVAASTCPRYTAERHSRNTEREDRRGDHRADPSVGPALFSRRHERHGARRPPLAWVAARWRHGDRPLVPASGVPGTSRHRVALGRVGTRVRAGSHCTRLVARAARASSWSDSRNGFHRGPPVAGTTGRLIVAAGWSARRRRDAGMVRLAPGTPHLPPRPGLIPTAPRAWARHAVTSAR
jgi:hypothetical protein